MRPQEITSWLHAYHETAGTPERPYVESYVAIDDRPLLAEQGGEQLRGHFVHTRVSVGAVDGAAVEVNAAGRDRVGGGQRARPFPALFPF